MQVFAAANGNHDFYDATRIEIHPQRMEKKKGIFRSLSFYDIVLPLKVLGSFLSVVISNNTSVNFNFFILF